MSKRVPIFRRSAESSRDYVVNYAEVDDEDFEYVNAYSKWRLHNHGYAVCKVWINGIRSTVLMHRLIMNVSDPNVHVDHKDHDKLNNCKSNLLPGTQQENNQNSSPLPRSDSSSRFKGVGRYRGGWRAQGWKHGKTVWLGKYSTEEDAKEAYRKWVLSNE